MLPASVRIFLRREPTDMRRGFDRLAAMVTEAFQENPLSGHLFVFRNKRGDRVKILFWDRDGYAVFHKRLEKGTFTLPEAGGEINQTDLAMLLQGIEHAKIRRTERFILKAPASRKD